MLWKPLAVSVNTFWKLSYECWRNNHFKIYESFVMSSQNSIIKCFFFKSSESLSIKKKLLTAVTAQFKIYTLARNEKPMIADWIHTSSLIFWQCFSRWPQIQYRVKMRWEVGIRKCFLGIGIRLIEKLLRLQFWVRRKEKDHIIKEKVPTICGSLCLFKSWCSNWRIYRLILGCSKTNNAQNCHCSRGFK